MTTRLFYKKIIAIEVLSEEPIPDTMTVDQIVFEATEGDYSMRVLPATETVLNAKEAAEALIQQDSDPSFFRLTEDGEDYE